MTANSPSNSATMSSNSPKNRTYPKTELKLKEGCYGSKLHLRVNPETNCCDGTYMPVVQKPKKGGVNIADEFEADDDDDDVVDIDGGGPKQGHAVLFGRIEPDAESDDFVLKGEWRHVQGPHQGGGGQFQMKLHENGVGSGWWAGGEEQAEEERKHSWNWDPEMEPLKSCKGEEFVVQTRRPSLGTEASITSSIFSAFFQNRPSLSRRLDRDRTFFDEFLESEGGSSVWIARWGVFCSWIFFWQTLAALIMASLEMTGRSTYVLQAAFNAVYTSTYMSFLIIYSRMAATPPLDYVMGVFLYTLGYACFFVLYVVVLAVDDEEIVTLLSGKLYVSGSLFFLVGSISLVHATVPPPITMVLYSLGKCESVCRRFSVIDQHSALFWGSVCFLTGSGSFTLDSAWDYAPGPIHPGEKPEKFTFLCVVAGYFVFTIGRLYFLWGSTTSECDIFFCKKGSAPAKKKYSVRQPAQGDAIKSASQPSPSSPGKPQWTDVMCQRIDENVASI